MPGPSRGHDFSRQEGAPAISAVELPGTLFHDPDGRKLFEYLRDRMAILDFDAILTLLRDVGGRAADPAATRAVIGGLTLLNDLRYATGEKRRCHLLHMVREELNRVFRAIPSLGPPGAPGAFRRIDLETRAALRAPSGDESVLVIDARGFPPEGDGCDAALLVRAFRLGWREFICFSCSGQRYLGCGLGPGSEKVVIDVHGSSGDYLGSGMDGLCLRVHGNAQDQVGQIIKEGKLVIFGDTGQTFMYGAKGGEIYLMGNAAGRPLINSVGRPRVVINGTALDFLAESFMAGDPHGGGGFVILNGVRFNDQGEIEPLPEPYSGSNLFSLASGGAIFIRDPHAQCVEGQLNGGIFLPLTQEDWRLIAGYLEENERLFGIRVRDLLTVNGRLLGPESVYRKVVPRAVGLKILEQSARARETETVGDLN
jgi:glutamate synthase domain-containing protein 3